MGMKWIATLVMCWAAGAAWAQSNLGVEFRWQIAHHCNTNSPVIKVKNIPAGTTTLEVVMTDLDSNNPVHGGPCPDNFTTLGHEYEIKVTALNANKQALSKGAHKAPFSGKFVILQGVIGSP
jgi:phosphatidylethanolamine-binding protein (PEBP) family uncharacterized protein